MKKIYFIISLLVFCASSIALIWYLGAGVLIFIDDLSLFTKDFTKYFGHFSLKILLPGSVSLLFSYFSGRNVIKHIRENAKLRTKKFKIILPVAGIAITVLGLLALIIYGFFLYKINPTNTEIGVGVSLGLILMSLGGLIFSIILGIIGFFLDRAIFTNNYAFPTIGVLKVFLVLLVLITAGSFIVNKIYFSHLSNSPTQDTSILKKAMSKNNPDLCSKNRWCYAMYYHETQDSDVCASMPKSVDFYDGQGNSNLRDQCYIYYAKEDGNPKLCDFVQEKIDKKGCLNIFSIES